MLSGFWDYAIDYYSMMLALNGYRPVREDVFLARVDGDFVSDWVEKQQQALGDSVVYILAKMTDKMARMLLMENIPEEMNRDSYLLLSAVNEEEKLPEITCLINFGSMDQQLV